MVNTSQKKILAIDDNPANLAMINGLLKDLYKVYLVDSGSVALKFLEKQRPDLILLDVNMPYMSGIDLMDVLKKDKRYCDIPVIFLTATDDVKNETLAFNLGAMDYIRKPINSDVLIARVKLHLELECYRNELQRLVEEKASHIILLQKITIDLLASASEFRDTFTGNHEKRTTGYVTSIMDNLSAQLPYSYHISKEYYDDIKKATPLHDIGKISIPDSILLKPSRLTPEEFEIMKKHTTSGAALLQNAIDELGSKSFLDVAKEIVLTHHEKWDGTGYPNGLAGENIPISGRIMAIADVYDALTSVRPYKTAFSHEKALQIIEEGKATHFDPILTDVFLSISDEILKIADLYLYKIHPMS